MKTPGKSKKHNLLKTTRILNIKL